jgi:hypothetical protein
MVPGFGYEVAAATHFVACPHAILMDAWTFVIWRRTVNVGVDTDIDFFLNGEKYSVAGQPLGDAQAGATPTIRALRGSSSSNEVDGGVGQVGVWLSALTDAPSRSSATPTWRRSARVCDRTSSVRDRALSRWSPGEAGRSDATYATPRGAPTSSAPAVLTS